MQQKTNSIIRVAATNDPRSSPRMPFSSPVMGTFSATKENNQNRPGHGRGRHGGSTASNTHGARPVSAAGALPPPSSGGMAMDIDPASPLLQSSLNNSSTSLNPRRGSVAEASGSRPNVLERNLPGASIQSESAAGDTPLPQPVVTTRTGRVSKAATPITGTFPELSKPVIGRGKNGNGNSGHEESNGNGNGGSHPSSESGAPSRMSTRDKRRVKKDSGGSPTSSRAGSTAGGVAPSEPAANAAVDAVDDGDATLEEIKPENAAPPGVQEKPTLGPSSGAANSAPAVAAPPHSAKSRLTSSTPQASPALKPAASKKAVPALDPDEDEDEDLDPEDEDLEDADDEGDGEIDDEEPRYCYCDGVSYGSMVACDNEDCAKQWFHLKCAGLKVEPKKEETWFCDTCKEMGFGVEDGGSKRKKTAGKGKKTRQ
jgi:hypothetical protein